MSGAGDEAARLVVDAIRRWRSPGGPPLVVGLCGPQGSGKSTIAAGIAARLAETGVTTAILSLDDLYLDRTARAKLAASVHPLLATRGVPGTHDVALGVAVLARLRDRHSVALPRFDKATDDPVPRDHWPRVEEANVVLFEGWCVGARAGDPAALADPINRLEREEDPDGRWRTYVDAQLAGPYRALFDALDRLVLLLAPGFGSIVGWRQEAERKLIASGDAPNAMTPDDVERFIAHFERITRRIALEMPARADLTIQLGESREVRSVRSQ